MVVGHTDWGADLIIIPSLVRYKLGLRFHYLRVGFKVTPKAVGSDSSLRSPYSVGSCPYIPCSEFVRGGSRTILAFPSVETFTNYVTKLKSCPTNPAYGCVFEPQNAKLHEVSIRHSSPRLRMLPHLESSGLDLNVVDGVLDLGFCPLYSFCTKRAF